MLVFRGIVSERHHSCTPAAGRADRSREGQKSSGCPCDWSGGSPLPSGLPCRRTNCNTSGASSPPHRPVAHPLTQARERTISQCAARLPLVGPETARQLSTVLQRNNHLVVCTRVAKHHPTPAA